MFNLRKFMSVSAIAVLGVTNLLTPLSYASAATPYDSLSEAELKVKMLQFMMPDKHVYLKAYTEANKYFVHYDGNDETSGEMGDENGNQEFTYDTTGNLASNAFAKTGYSFNEWKDGSGVSHANNAEVFNWTAAESGVVNVYAQWTANHYLIHYDLNDATGSSKATSGSQPEEAVYNSGFTVDNPSRQGYAFSGWTVSDMDSNPHTVGGNPSTATLEEEVMGTSFNNLTATGGATVNFLANWNATLTDYIVRHFQQALDGTYPAEATDELTGSAATDSDVTPAVMTYTGFTAPATQTTGVKADGTTAIRYEYTRNPYALTLNAGNGIKSVTATGTNSAILTTEDTKTQEFLFDEHIVLAFEPADGYENGAWTGSDADTSEFNMPASAISRTAYATPIVYNIVYQYKGADYEPSNPATYTVESGVINISDPSREHSKFAGWIGGVDGGAQLATGTTPLSFGPYATGHRTYTATWTCVSGFYLSSDTTECRPNADTEYHVEHYFQKLAGSGYDFDPEQTTTQTGQTLSGTDAKPIAHEGFEVKPIDNEAITGDGSTVIKIRYDRLNYNTTVTSTSGVTVTHVGQYDDKNGNAHPHHQYGDTVTITATTGAGYTFNGWEVKDASGNTVDSVANANATTTTFTMPASAVTIKANTTANTYTITMDPNGGTISGGNTITYTVETETFDLPTPTRNNSVFEGWRGTSGTTPTETTNPLPITKGSVGDRTYEAVWGCETGYTLDGNKCEANTYKVTVDTMDGGNGGVSSGETLIFTYDDPTTIPNPTQSGYTFAGWTVSGYDPDTARVDGDPLTSPTTSGEEFENLTPTSGATVTLVANWTPNSDTQYVVNYYVRDLGATSYTLTGTVTGHAETNTGITLATEAAKQTYEGFKYSSGYVGVGDTTRPTAGDVLTTTVDKYGNTVINLYFDRNKWHVYLTGDAHVNTVIGENDYEYGEDVSVNMTAKEGYHFKEWKKKTAETFNSAD